MSKSCELSLMQRSLFQQGYQNFSAAELKQLEWGLRFTPAACSTLTAIGLYFQLPYLLLMVGTLGIWAFFFPAAHPMDLIYNHAVRHLFGASALPENPLQRRLACLSAGVMNFMTAGFFLAGWPLAALVTGGLLLILQAIVITTHFCTLSWMYEGVMRLLGKWKMPIQMKEAKTLLDHGAILVDVRSPLEYAEGSIKGAINMPLEELDKNIKTFGEQPVLLFCRSGFRSHIALEKLKSLGIKENVFNLGAFSRAESIVLAPA